MLSPRHDDDGDDELRRERKKKKEAAKVVPERNQNGVCKRCAKFVNFAFEFPTLPNSPHAEML